MSDFDFIEHYGDSEEVKGEEQLDENEVIFLTSASTKLYL